MKAFIIFIKLIVAFHILMGMASCVDHGGYIAFKGYAQGGEYTVKINMDGVAAHPEEIRDSVEMILKRIDHSLSGYNKKSLLSRFNAGETIVPDTLFIDIYSKAFDVYRETGGVVDVASAPLFDIWGFGFRSGEMPDDSLVAATMAASGMKRMRYDMAAVVDRNGSLNGRDMLLVSDGSLPRLNYNAIAQGYSCDVVARYLYSIGVKDMLVDIGEIFCDGKNPSGKPWTLAIDRPEDGNNEPGSDIQAVFKSPQGPHGIVTSGNYRKYYVRDGKKYAHTIDPRTGYPVSHNLLSATIVASDALTADAYATYCMAVGLEAARTFLESRDDLEGCLIYDEDGAFRTWCSDGFLLD